VTTSPRVFVLAGVLLLWPLAGGCTARLGATDVIYVGAAHAADASAWIEDDAGTKLDGSAGDDAGSAAATATLTFEVLTKSQGGHYSPRNIGAIWIEDDHGKWVKTLALWAHIRQVYLYQFKAASRGNTVDAVTSATLAQHIAHKVSWNMSDAAGAVVPDGRYHVRIEVADADYPGNAASVPFTKGAMHFETTAPDTESFVNMRLSLR
jgi:hypothetical protein